MTGEPWEGDFDGFVFHWDDRFDEHDALAFRCNRRYNQGMTTTITASSLAQERARTNKALRLTATLRTAGATLADYDADRIDWTLAEQAAGVRPASQATRQMVRAMLAVAEGTTPADPFQGL